MSSKILDDYTLAEDFAKEIRRHPRTVKRMRLPSLRVGNQLYIHIPSARKEFERRVQRRSPRRISGAGDAA